MTPDVKDSFSFPEPRLLALKGVLRDQQHRYVGEMMKTRPGGIVQAGGNRFFTQDGAGLVLLPRSAATASGQGLRRAGGATV
jgi:hypothetical protein